MEAVDTLVKYGQSYQSKVVASLISDVKFLEQVTEITKPAFFESQANQWIIGEVQNYFNEFRTSPTMEVFKIKVGEVEDKVLKQTVVEQLKSVYLQIGSEDLPYVKNATAHYRQLLDEILLDMPEYAKTSSGLTSFSFTPQPEKTFNRSATDYFVNGRQDDIGAFDTPKFSGEEVGRVTKVAKDSFEVDSQIELHNGDGLCFFDVHKELVGMRINTVEGKRLTPNEMPEDMRRGMTLYRNRDHAFMRLLEKDSATRKIPVEMHFYEMPDGFALTVTDSDGLIATALCKV
jgi:hypothetical protein